jgi:hypothetical protein
MKYKPKQESGYALVLAMVLMLAATLVSIEGMRGTILQERMARNQNSKMLSYMSAEVGAKAFLSWIESEFATTKTWFCDPPGTGNNTDGVCTVTVDESVIEKDLGNNQTYAISDLEWTFEDVSFTVTGRLEVEGKVLSETQMDMVYGNPNLGGFKGDITGISRKSDHIPIYRWVEKNIF